MKYTAIILLSICCSCLGGETVNASGIDPHIDVQLFASSSLVIGEDEQSVVDGGFGKARFGGNENNQGHTAVKFNDVSAVINARANSELSLFLHAQHQPEQTNPIDLVEGFVQYKPALTSRWRPLIAFGSFFPELSFENQGLAWTNLYTITNNAANSWIGQEVRSTGIKVGSTYRGDLFDFALHGTLFGWNDVSGVGLAYGGFTYTDLKTPVFGKVRLPDVNVGVRPIYADAFRELDNRPGFALDAHIDHFELGKLSLSLWDNFGDLSDSRPGAAVWRTQFASLAAEVYLPHNYTLLPQVMIGTTKVPLLASGDKNKSTFFTSSAMLVKDWNDFRYALRGDYFQQKQSGCSTCFDSTENGVSGTVAVSYFHGDHNRFTAEAIYIDYQRNEDANRASYSNDETVLQLNYQLSF